MEAMALGDRIAIINKGEIVQVGTGDEIYYMPCNEFVAQLMGDPQINIIPGTIASTGDSYEFSFKLNDQTVTVPMPEDKDLYDKIRADGVSKVDMGLRPQNVKYSFEPKDGYFRSSVYSYESIGNKSVIVAECGDFQLRMISPNGLKIEIDQDVYINLEVDRSMIFDPQTKEYICRYDEETIKAFAAEAGGK
jgi:ABC-type sugar transport system ATPase subunit